MKRDDEKLFGEITRDDLKTAAAACEFKASRVGAHAEARRGQSGSDPDVLDAMIEKANKLEELATRLKEEAR